MTGISNLMSRAAFISLMLMLLANTVYAAEKEGVVIDSPLPTPDVACGASPRTIQYMLTNEGDTRVELYDISVVVQSDDDFPTTNLLTPATPTSWWQCGYENVSGRSFLYPGDSCYLDIILDASQLDCGNGESFPPQGLIDRNVVITLNNFQRELIENIETNVTYLGSADTMTVVANNVCNSDALYGERCNEDMTAENPFMTQTTCTTYPCIVGNTTITEVQGWNAAMVPAPYSVYRDSDNTQLVLDDLNAAFQSFLDMQNGDEPACNMLNPDLNADGEFTFNPGVYCFSSTPVTITDQIIFNNDANSLVVIIIDSNVPENYLLEITGGGNFALNDINGLDNIFWIINGNSIINSPFVADNSASHYEMVGNVLTTGYFEIDIAPNTVLGRILSIDNDVILNDTSKICGVGSTGC